MACNKAMKHFKYALFCNLLLCFLHIEACACTIVAVSGRITEDGRPLLLKNRDSSRWDIRIKIEQGDKYVYLCQCVVPDGNALSGYNEAGFAIVNFHSYNMPNTAASWNSYIMQLSLETCATVDEFELMLDTLPKPMPVSSNYGVMDAQGNVAVFETNEYSYTRYDANDEDCGLLVRTNHSFSEDITGISISHPTSIPRYLIATTFLENVITTSGFITKEDIFGLVRCLVNREGVDLRDFAPFDENSYTPVSFQYYVPRYSSTSAMVIQGVLPSEQPILNVAWTMVGSPMASVAVPYIITSGRFLPQKAQIGDNGHSWFCYIGQQLKNSCFVDNTTLELAKLYNQSGTGVMQKIGEIEEEIIVCGNNLVNKLRTGTASYWDVEQYYAWMDEYVEEQYVEYNLLEPTTNETNNVDENKEEPILEYYNILGQRVKNVRPDAIIKRSGHIGIIIN